MAETRQLLEEIAAIDNREISPEAIAAWNGILGSMPLDVAREAHKLARRDDRVRYLEPKHLVSWARDAAFKLDRQQAVETKPFRSDPQPTCRDHGKPILTCDPCCHRMSKYVQMRGDDTLLDFAKKEIYA